jgi:hypothetical protein
MVKMSVDNQIIVALIGGAVALFVAVLGARITSTFVKYMAVLLAVGMFAFVAAVLIRPDVVCQYGFNLGNACGYTGTPPGHEQFYILEKMLRADPFDYSGPCPVKVTFSGRISIVGSGRVTYKFIRSDGASAPVQRLVFDGSGSQDVTETWTLGGKGTNYTGWEAVQIIDPVDPKGITSERAPFTIRCN